MQSSALRNTNVIGANSRGSFIPGLLHFIPDRDPTGSLTLVILRARTSSYLSQVPLDSTWHFCEMKDVSTRTTAPVLRLLRGDHPAECHHFSWPAFAWRFSAAVSGVPLEGRILYLSLNFNHSKALWNSKLIGAPPTEFLIQSIWVWPKHLHF